MPLRGRFLRVMHNEDPVVQLPPDELIVDWHFEHAARMAEPDVCVVFETPVPGNTLDSVFRQNGLCF